MKHLLVAAATAALFSAPGLAMATTFDKADMNKDGQLTRSEFAATPYGGEYWDFASLDRNADGVITYSEVAFLEPNSMDRDAQYGQRPNLSAGVGAATLGRGYSDLDVNGDGHISLNERANAAPGEDGPYSAYPGARYTYDGNPYTRTPSQRAANANAGTWDADTNGDGRVSFAERANAGPGEPGKNIPIFRRAASSLASRFAGAPSFKSPPVALT